EIVSNISELVQYATEKLNPENVKKVEQVIVEHPLFESFKNVSLIDTPGLGSLYKHNSMATLEWLPFTGVALITIGAERPIAEEDINLIKGVSQYCREVAIVLTKTDLFTQNQLDEIKSYLVRELTKTTGSHYPVYEYSIIKNTHMYRQNILEQIIMPIHTQADIKLREITNYKLNKFLDNTLMYTELALQGAIKKETAKESVVDLLNEIRNNRQHHEREMIWSGASFKEKVREKLEKIVLPYHKHLVEKIIQQFNEEYPTWKGNLY
ncbi:MAG: hypothetical protein N2662_01465, partial [Bacteroidales bacterium]|nr:hypothetical protein [Bacteroidales bacterium]